MSLRDVQVMVCARPARETSTVIDRNSGTNLSLADDSFTPAGGGKRRTPRSMQIFRRGRRNRSALFCREIKPVAKNTLSTDLDIAWGLAGAGCTMERGVTSMRGSRKLLGLDIRIMREILSYIRPWRQDVTNRS